MKLNAVNIILRKCRVSFHSALKSVGKYSSLQTELPTRIQLTTREATRFEMLKPRCNEIILSRELLIKFNSRRAIFRALDDMAADLYGDLHA